MYGYADDPIAAQVQLYQYPQASDVGELESLGAYLGEDYGWAGELVSGATGLLGTGLQALSANKQAKQQQQLMEQQADLLAQQADLQARADAAKMQRLLLILGVGTLVVGGGVAVMKWPQIKKKLGRR